MTLLNCAPSFSGSIYLLLFFIFIPALLVCSLVLKINYLLVIYSLLNKIEYDNRNQLIWLELVPLVGLIWQFINVFTLLKSLNKEFEYKSIIIDDFNFNYSLGVIFSLLSLTSIFFFAPLLSNENMNLGHEIEIGIVVFGFFY